MSGPSEQKHAKTDALKKARAHVLKRHLSLTSSVPILIHASVKSGDLEALKKQLKGREILLKKRVESILDALEEHKLELNELMGQYKNTLGNEYSVKALCMKMRLMALEFDDLYKSRIPPLIEDKDGDNGLNILECAAYYGSLDICQHLVDVCGMEIVAKRTPESEPECSALIWAIKKKKLRIVRYLVEKNASLCIDRRYHYFRSDAMNSSDGGGFSRHNGDVCESSLEDANTALHFAAERSAEITSYLVKAKADMSLRNAQGLTALELAVAGDHEDTFRALIRADTSTMHKLLFTLVDGRKNRCFRAFLEEGGVLVWKLQQQSVRKHYFSAMMKKQDYQLMEALLGVGVIDLTTKNTRLFEEESILLAALWSIPSRLDGSKQCANARKFIKLLASPGNVNTKARSGETPLTIVLRQIKSLDLQRDMVADLIAIKADIDAPVVCNDADDKEKKRRRRRQPHLIFEVLRKRFIPLLTLILAHTRVHDINNLRDLNGRTVCGAAVLHAPREAVRCLLDARADVNLPMNADNGGTPLILCVRNLTNLPPLRMMRMVEFLITSAAANCLAKDNGGCIAADYAKDMVRSIRSTERYKRTLATERHDTDNKAYTSVYKYLRKVELRYRCSCALMRDAPSIHMLYPDIAAALNLKAISFNYKEIERLVRDEQKSPRPRPRPLRAEDLRHIFGARARHIPGFGEGVQDDGRGDGCRTQ